MIGRLPAPLRMVPMLLGMATIFYLSNQPGDSLYLPPLPGIDKLAHLVVYGALAAATLLAWSERWKQERARLTVLLTVCFCFFYGLSDEFHQSFIPGRSPSLADILADSAGAALLGFLWLRLQGRGRRLSN